MPSDFNNNQIAFEDFHPNARVVLANRCYCIDQLTLFFIFISFEYFSCINFNRRPNTFDSSHFNLPAKYDIEVMSLPSII